MTKGSAITGWMESVFYHSVTFPQTRAVLEVSSTTDLRRYLAFVFKVITKLGNTIYLSISQDMFKIQWPFVAHWNTTVETKPFFCEKSGSWNVMSRYTALRQNVTTDFFIETVFAI